MLSMKPTGMIHPGDIWLQEAINNVVLQPWRKTVGAVQLRVPEGQVTFDAEGMIIYSRIMLPRGRLKDLIISPEYCTGLVMYPASL
jgi:hypothetical protein